MTATADDTRSRFGLLHYEQLLTVYGVAAASASVLLASRESLPQLWPLLTLCTLSALSVHFNTDADDRGRVSASAQSVVAAAAVVTFRGSSPLLAPLLVGMAAAFWRVPKTRHQWFSIPGNLGAYGLPALCAAAVVSALDLGAHPSAWLLAAVAMPASLALAALDAALIASYLALCERVPLRKAAQKLIAAELATAGGGYVPFLFGAFVGELALRFGLVVFGLAAVAFVMVQAVFAGIRKLLESERDTCDGLIAAVERKDLYTAGHSKRVVRYAHYMGERLGFKGRDLARLDRQALMHDIGKLAVPNHVLRKPGRLDPDERDLMFRHEPAGEAILASIPMLALSADIASGRGHADGLDGPVRATHVVHAADAFDAMTTTRAYRRAKRQDEARAEMLRCAGVQFHPACVAALFNELDGRGEVYGAGGCDADSVVYDTPPPEGTLGETLAEQAAADAGLTATAIEMPAPSPVELDTPRTRPPRAALVAGALGGVALITSVCSATFGVSSAIALPLSLAALVALGEVVCLRPVRGVARPLSLVAMLATLRAVSLPVAAVTVGAGIALGAALDANARNIRYRVVHLARRAGAAAAAVAAFAILDRAWPGNETVAGVLVILVATIVVALATQELLEGVHLRLAAPDRLADVALLACAPLAALATAGVAGRQGLGLGALPILVVPLALLAHGLDRTRQARENLFAWIKAASLAPEHAELVAPGRAARVVTYALGMAQRVGLDDDMQDQLAAAAWMEHVGECCLDEAHVTGRPHRQDQIVEESAAILQSTRAFHEAGEVLHASLLEPELTNGSAIDRAGQVLRVAVAFENATAGNIVLDEIPELFAMLRCSNRLVLDNELCDALQQLVAPGSRRSTWRPVRTHAILTCRCTLAVDESDSSSDDARCPQHEHQAVDELALDAARVKLAEHNDLVQTIVEMLEAAGCEPSCTNELQ